MSLHEDVYEEITCIKTKIKIKCDIIEDKTCLNTDAVKSIPVHDARFKQFQTLNNKSSGKTDAAVKKMHANFQKLQKNRNIVNQKEKKIFSCARSSLRWCWVFLEQTQILSGI